MIDYGSKDEFEDKLQIKNLIKEMHEQNYHHTYKER